MISDDYTWKIVAVVLTVLWIYQHHWWIKYQVRLWLEHFFLPIPTIHVDLPSTPTLMKTTTTKTTMDAEKEKKRQEDGAPPPPLSVSAPSLVDPHRPGRIQCWNPCNGDYLGQVPAMTKDQVNEACQKAALAQLVWKETTFAQRRQVLRTLQKFIVSHMNDICRATGMDSGKAAVDAILGELLTTCEKIATLIRHGEEWLQSERRPTSLLTLHKNATVEYVPLGVIATIAPWNYPFHNFINHILSGIFSGNAVVGKVSEHTSWSSYYYFDAMIRASLEVNGHDGNLCQTIVGFGDAGQALCQNSLVDKIIFTGSPEIGRQVMKTASEQLKPVILELGGKDALVIMNDCKLEEVLPWVMRGSFQNCGQNCVGIERVLVYESLYQEFIDKAQSKIKALRQGDVFCSTTSGSSMVDCGALVMKEQLGKIQDLVDDAVLKGAKVLCGGKMIEGGGEDKKGQFYPPTLLVHVTPAMNIFHTEVFGPVMSVIKVPNDSDEACLKLANGTSFGLGSSVYTGNPKRGLDLGRKIRSGMLCVNDFGSNYLVQSLPFGGVKESGFGRFAGVEGLRALCLERSILTDRIPGVKTNIPKALDYPIQEKGLHFATSLIQFFYNESILGKIKGILGLIKFG